MLKLNVDVREVAANSYTNFHTTGLDYLCLKRSEQQTLKVYFFTDMQEGEAVVSPHDHRYDFNTTVMRGRLINNRYATDDTSIVRYDRYDYRTPLNGGDGFTYASEERLSMTSREAYVAGVTHSHTYDEKHTIEVTSGTIIFLEQHEDRVPLTTPTSCWVERHPMRPNVQAQAPTLTNVNHKMNERTALYRLMEFEKLLLGDVWLHEEVYDKLGAAIGWR